MNSTIKAGGSVIVPPKPAPAGAKGSIMGGEVWAKKALMVHELGSQMAAHTHVTVGVDFDQEARLRDFDKAQQFCDGELSRISKALRVGVWGIDRLKQHIAGLPAAKRKPYVEAMQRLQEMSQIRRQLTEKRESLSQSAVRLADEACITVRRTLHAGVQIQVGPCKLRLERPLSHLLLRLDGQAQRIKVESLERTRPGSVDFQRSGSGPP